MTDRLDAALTVRDPRTGQVRRPLAAPSRQELAEIARSLRASQPAWSAASPEDRAAALRALAASVQRHRAAIIEALVADTGRLGESELEVQVIQGTLERWAEVGPQLLAEPAAQMTALPWIEIRAGLRPFALVGAVTPWNFPLLLGLIDAIPALMAGCAVIAKPSEVTPRFVAPFMSAVDEVPEIAAVLSLIEGGPETGAAVLDEVDAIAFTGSVPTGRMIAERAAARFVPAFLELGGKDPAIVLAGADLDHAARAVLWGGTANAGQSCLSIERVYVQRSVFDSFVEILISAAQALPLAYPEPADGVIGPIIAADQVDVIADHLTDATAKGAKALTGGTVEWLGGGAYVRPTVLVDVDHSMLVMREETFGPLLPVMPVDGPDEAVQLANDSAYGLSAAVFAATPEEALAVARRIDAGAVSINDAALTALVHEGEKNSFKLSGLGGSRMGPAALTRFLRKQAFIVNPNGQPDPWWHNTSDA